MLTQNDSSPTANAKKLTVWTHRPTTRGGCLAGDTLLVNADSDRHPSRVRNAWSAVAAMLRPV